MLPRENRLTKKSDFTKVFKIGRVTGGVFLSLVGYISGGGIPKIGFIVSNKISKKAVERNRLKRIMRQAAKPRLDNVKDGARLVFLAKRKAVGATSEEIANESLALLKQSGVWRGLSMKK